MNIPGANLLSIAARVLRFETVGHRAFTGRAVNAAGDWVSTFAASVDISASVQAVNTKLYQQLGLDLTKNYIMIYTSANVLGTDRDREGDLITFAGATWQAQSGQDWRPMDSFRKMLCIEVPAS
jgi:hypothetical protein